MSRLVARIHFRILLSLYFRKAQQKLAAQADRAEGHHTEGEAENLLKCPRDDCEHRVKTRAGLTKHEKWHKAGGKSQKSKPKVCHLCGKHIQRDLIAHLAYHE